MSMRERSPLPLSDRGGGLHRNRCFADRGNSGKASLRGELLVREACEGSTCTLMFADHTRGHARALVQYVGLRQ